MSPLSQMERCEAVQQLIIECDDEQQLAKFCRVKIEKEA